jgi:RHS repeat-associated protein
MSTFDRVISTVIGGTNAHGIPAGGAINNGYQIIAPTASSANDPYMQMIQTDRRGNVTEYISGPGGTVIETKERTRGLRNNEPAAFVTRNQYNKDKKLIVSTFPEGNTVTYTLDNLNPDRFQQGNILTTVHTPGPRGADQAALTTKTTYEPVYQQAIAVTDSRGLDPAFNPPIGDACGRTTRERYTRHTFFDYQESPVAQILPLLAAELSIPEVDVKARLDAAGIQLGLGDLNGDGDVSPRIDGTVIRLVEPSVSLLAGSNQAVLEGDACQEIITLMRYNSFGKVTSVVDPEGNQDNYKYFPETDPDGDASLFPASADGRSLNTTTGGYLREVVRDTVSSPTRNSGTDPVPTMIRETYTYNDVGQRTSMTDGRGIHTDYIVNELDQVVRTIQAAAGPGVGTGNPSEPIALTAFAYLQDTLYDFNDNIVEKRQEDRGNTSNTGGMIETKVKYDILDKPIEISEEVDTTNNLVTQIRYNPNEYQTLTIFPVGNAEATAYDERDILFQSTRGALTSTSETLGAPASPYNPRGGVPSIMTYNVNQNGYAIETVDAADTDGSSGNNSIIAGSGDAFTIVRDGYDREIIRIDATGNEQRLTYDPVDNVVKVTRRGPVGGASPKNRLGTGNVDLSIEETSHDERNRPFQTDQVLFVSTGVVTQRPSDISDGQLTPGDGRVTTHNEYDRKSRVTFTVEDDLDTYRRDYDGADREVKNVDPEGNIVESAYDDNNNLIEVRETDVAQIAGIADEIFLTTMFFDSLNRLTMRVENTVDFIAQASRYRYDSRNNLIAVSDSKGLQSGEESNRRVFSSALVDLNDPGNVTLFSYDGINRKTLKQKILTQVDAFFGAEGLGDPGADEFGIKSPIAVHFPDPTQGGGDGIISTRSVWDDNSLLFSLTDDNGNQTQYGYDNLNRQLTETKGVVVAPALADRDDPDTTISLAYDLDDNLIRIVDESGSVFTLGYDGIDRRISTSINRGPGITGTTQQIFEYDGLSRLRFTTDNNDPSDATDNSVLTFAYDSLTRIFEETQMIGAISAKAVSSGWRAENLRVNLTYPNGRIIESTFDQLDRLDIKRDRGSKQELVDYDYIGRSRILRRRFPINGTRMTSLNDAGDSDIGYDSLRRPVQLRHLRSDNSLVVGFTHSYDLMDNKLREEKLHDPKNSEIYQYDSVYRLMNFQRGMLNNFRSSIVTPSANSLQQKTWDLDGVGNWTESKSTAGGVATNEARQHSSFNELITRAATSLRHDGNGNRLDDGVMLFEWDAFDRLKTIRRKADNTLVAIYMHDGLDRRTRKEIINGGLTNNPVFNGITDYYYDGWRVIEERSVGDATVTQYVYGGYIDEVLVRDNDTSGDSVTNGKGDIRLWYHQNTLASVFALTTSAGTIAEGYQYDAYGKIIIFEPGSNGVVDFGGDDIVSSGRGASPLGTYSYTGRRWDAESGLVYYRYRTYDPGAGRFLGRDPMPAAEKLYEYVRGNPVMWGDPLGLQDTGTKVRTRTRKQQNAACKWVYLKTTPWKEVPKTRKTVYEPGLGRQVSQKQSEYWAYDRSREELEDKFGVGFSGGFRPKGKGISRLPVKAEATASYKIRNDWGTGKKHAGQVQTILLTLVEVYVIDVWREEQKNVERQMCPVYNYDCWPEVKSIPKRKGWLDTGLRRVVVLWRNRLEIKGYKWLPLSATNEFTYTRGSDEVRKHVQKVNEFRVAQRKARWASKSGQ